MGRGAIPCYLIGGNKMEYNTEKNIKEIKMLISFIQDNTREVLESLSLGADNDTLDCMWRLREMIGDYAEEARVLIGKMIDEREDTEGA
jgi:hypothetical protein